MNKGKIIDNQFVVTDTLEKKDYIELVSACYLLNRYHILIIHNDSNNELYLNFNSYIKHFPASYKHSKTDEYAYLVYGCTNKTLNEYLKKISIPSIEQHTSKTPTVQKQKIKYTDMKFEDLVAEIEKKTDSSKVLSNHYLLLSKNIGAVKEMLGEVMIINFLVDEPGSSWNEIAIAEYKSVFNKALKFLESEAKRYGSKIKFTVVHKVVTSQFEVSRNNDNMIIPAINKIINNLGKRNITDYQSFYKKMFTRDETPVLIALNKRARSCAWSASTKYPDTYEVCFIARQQSSGIFSEYTIAHEILHLFGAPDLYYPEKIYNNAKIHFPDSIMHGGRTVDDLTAYSVGWSKKLNTAAEKYLESVKEITWDDYIKAARLENTKQNE